MSLKSGLLALALLLTSAAIAAPSFLGPTGLVLIPTADALVADEMAFSLYGAEGGGDTAYLFNYGIRENLEVGFTRFTDRETVINAKYNFQPEDGHRAGVAMGVVDLTDQVNSSLYVVASKKFTVSAPGITNMRMHAGLSSGGTSQSDVPLDGFFGGISVDISSRVVVSAEHDGSHFNFGASGLLGKGVQVNIGAVGEDLNFLYGLSYNTKF